MKKFVKVSLITAGILFVVGCALGSISVMAEGRSFIRMIKEEKTAANTWGTKSDQIEAAQVKNIELELGAGTFTIKEKEETDGLIDISTSGIGNCKYYVDGETLHVEGFQGKWASVIKSDNRIEISIPQNSSFEEITVDAGAGMVALSDITARELELQGGAGEFSLKDMEIADLNVEIGAGRVEAKGLNAVNAELSVGMGEISYEGAITGDLDIECGMGNTELRLSGKETDHNYLIECSAGNVDIGSFSVSAMATEKVIYNNAASNFDIECSMGNVTIDFTDK